MNIYEGAWEVPAISVHQSIPEWKYINTRRFILFVEESIKRGLQSFVFEPNNQQLWAKIRQNIGSFLYSLFRQGAFAGENQEKAYFVECDSQTNPPTQVDLGRLSINIGFAPVKTAEFVIIRIVLHPGTYQR